MKLRGIVQGFGWILCTVLISSQFLTAQQGDAAAGKAVFTKSCAGCHAPAGEGKDTLAKALKVEMRHLGSKEVQAKSDDQIRNAVVEGLGKMKPVKGLSGADLNNLLAYTRSLAEK